VQHFRGSSAAYETYHKCSKVNPASPLRLTFCSHTYRLIQSWPLTGCLRPKSPFVSTAGLEPLQQAGNKLKRGGSVAIFSLSGKYTRKISCQVEITAIRLATHIPLACDSVPGMHATPFQASMGGPERYKMMDLRHFRHLRVDV
jgi:hypothetical protein